MNRRFILSIPLTVCCLICVGSTTKAQYTYTTIDFPGADETLVFGINNNGVFVGEYGNVDFSNPSLSIGNRGFVFDGQSYETLEVPGALSTSPSSINDFGVVVGEFLASSGNVSGFIYDGQDYTQIDFPGAGDSSLSGINNDGRVVGTYSNDGFQNDVHGFRFDGQEFEEVNFPFAELTFLTGINDADQEVGTFISAGVGQASGFVLPSFTTINVPAGLASLTRANDINDDGIVAGTVASLESQGFNVVSRFDGYLFDTATSEITNLQLPGPACFFNPQDPGTECRQSLSGINNSQTIVGYFDNDDGEYHGFVGRLAIPGDTDFDGDVDGQDVLNSLIGFGMLEGATAADGDFDNDGDSDRADFAILRQSISGGSPTNVTAVPEPSTYAIVLAVGCMWLVRHSRSNGHLRRPALIIVNPNPILVIESLSPGVRT